MKYLHENGCPWNEDACAIAAKGGHVEVLKWLHENGCPWNKRTCAYAANEGQLEMLQYLRENGCPWDEQTCTHAMERGHLHVLKWIHENGCQCSEDKHNQAEKGYYGKEVAEWMKQYRHSQSNNYRTKKKHHSHSKNCSLC
jgi:hypothetical protein